MAESLPSGRRIITVDCRELEPPQPLIRVLETIDMMRDDEAVLMLHRQKPCILLPKLEKLGFRYDMTEKGDGSIELLIWREQV